MSSAIGQQVAQDDGAPAKREEREQRRKAFRMFFAKMREHRAAIEVLLVRLERHSGMQGEIADAGERVIPAEILKVEEREPPVLSAQRIVRAEVGSNQSLAGPLTVGVEIEAEAIVGPPGRCARTRQFSVKSRENLLQSRDPPGRGREAFVPRID